MIKCKLVPIGTIQSTIQSDLLMIEAHIVLHPNKYESSDIGILLKIMKSRSTLSTDLECFPEKRCGKPGRFYIQLAHSVAFIQTISQHRLQMNCILVSFSGQDPVHPAAIRLLGAAGNESLATSIQQNKMMSFY